jgi:hypothetical protein
VSLVVAMTSTAMAASANNRIDIIFADFTERTGLFFVAKDHVVLRGAGIRCGYRSSAQRSGAISGRAANEAQFYIAWATGSSLGAMAAGLDLAHAALINKLDGYFVTS